MAYEPSPDAVMGAEVGLIPVELVNEQQLACDMFPRGEVV
jgi:hypothetical protein